MCSSTVCFPGSKSGGEREREGMCKDGEEGEKVGEISGVGRERRENEGEGVKQKRRRGGEREGTRRGGRRAFGKLAWCGCGSMYM